MRFPLGVALTLSVAGYASAQSPSLDPARFAKLHALIKPDGKEESWTQIPWRSSLWEARREAAQAGKPILLWEMDGHPLGCV